MKKKDSDATWLERVMDNQPIRFGLYAQGHIPTVERMLQEGKTWDEIGTAIGWIGSTAEQHYQGIKSNWRNGAGEPLSIAGVRRGYRIRAIPVQGDADLEMGAFI
jgi:hypothetical protein